MIITIQNVLTLLRILLNPLKRCENRNHIIICLFVSRFSFSHFAFSIFGILCILCFVADSLFVLMREYVLAILHFHIYLYFRISHFHHFRIFAVSYFRIFAYSHTSILAYYSPTIRLFAFLSFLIVILQVLSACAAGIWILKPDYLYQFSPL